MHLKWISLVCLKVYILVLSQAEGGEHTWQLHDITSIALRLHLPTVRSAVVVILALTQRSISYAGHYCAVIFTVLVASLSLLIWRWLPLAKIHRSYLICGWGSTYALTEVCHWLETLCSLASWRRKVATIVLAVVASSTSYSPWAVADRHEVIMFDAHI